MFLVGRVEARIADADLVAKDSARRGPPGSPEGREGGPNEFTHTPHGARARDGTGGYVREAHVGLSTGCARFSEGAKRLTIGEVQLCRRKQSHMRSQGLAVAFRRQPSCTAALDFDHFQYPPHARAPDVCDVNLVLLSPRVERPPPSRQGNNPRPALPHGSRGPSDPLASPPSGRAHRFKPTWGLAGRTPHPLHARALSGACALSIARPRLCLMATAGHPTRSQARPLGGHTGSSPRGAHRPYPAPAARTRPEWCVCARCDRLTPPSRPSGDPVRSPPRRTLAI